MPPKEENTATTLTTARSGWTWVVLVSLIGLFAAWDCARRGYWGLTVTVVLWVAAIVWFLALIFVKPKLSIDSEGVRCRNVLNEVFIPWRRLKDARRTLFVELVPDQGVPVKVWAAPVSAFKRVRGNSKERMDRSQLSQYGNGGGQSSAAHRDLSVAIVEERDQRLAGTKGRGMNGEVVVTRPTRDWLLLAGLVVVALLSLFLV